MARRARSPEKLAGLLIALGVLFLLLQIGVLGALPALLRLGLVALVGALVWQGSKGRLEGWQRVALLVALLVFALPVLGDLTGVFVLGLPALLFAWTYLDDPRRWWALIPAGVLGSLAGVVFLEAVFPRLDGGPFFLLGLAATFSFLYLLPRERGGQRWALFPAVGLILLTVLANDPGGTASGWFLPLLLIVGGLVLLWWRKQGR